MRDEFILINQQSYIWMNCISGQKGQFLCINRYCQVKNCFVCSDPDDKCKQSHESCSLINLPFLLKKSKLDNNPRSKQNRYDKLVPIYQKSKLISTTISNALASFNVIKEINNLLEDGDPLLPEDKDKIAKFMSDRKIQQAQDNIYSKIEKQLQQFQIIISEFQLGMKQQRNKEIEELRKKLQRQEKPSKVGHMPIQSRIDQFQTPTRSAKKLGKNEIFTQSGDFGQKKREKEEAAEIIPTPKKSKISQKQISPIKSSPVQKIEGISKIKKESEKERERQKQKEKEKDKKVEKVKSSIIRPRPGQFQEKISNTLKNHIPKPPLFSRITNDVQTINSFFQQAFDQAKLLYRASQSQYSVAKFHQKCDGQKFTLTLVLTEFDKIIGGYTPLPWRSGGGQWYPDQQKRTFIFNLTSGQKYPLLTPEKAIWCSKTYGPSFGHPDLEIADKAFHNSNSCANFPNCYNNGNYKSTPGSTQLFCGTKNGHFRIKQWEVYQLKFI